MIIFPLVVTYNKSCEHIKICKILLECSVLHPIVIDNSEGEYNNKKFCEKHGWLYFSMEGNKGLSKAYNIGINMCRKIDPEGVICLLDDDTDINMNYFSALEKSLIENVDCSVFFPMLRVSDRIVSPSLISKCHTFKFFKNYNEITEYKGERLTAFNSGMAIRLKVFNHFSYGETLFLDCIDHWFMRHVNQLNIKWRVIDYEAYHSLSSCEQPTLEISRSRFKICVHDFRHYCQSKPLFLFVIGKRAIHLTMIYKHFSFVHIFIKNIGAE